MALIHTTYLLLFAIAQPVTGYSHDPVGLISLSDLTQGHNTDTPTILLCCSSESPLAYPMLLPLYNVKVFFLGWF
jgi:hypothetical protein